MGHKSTAKSLCSTELQAVMRRMEHDPVFAPRLSVLSAKVRGILYRMVSVNNLATNEGKVSVRLILFGYCVGVGFVDGRIVTIPFSGNLWHAFCL